MLSLSRITKRFGGTRALDGASLEVRAGTVHAVLGENGAGKTTLMRVAFGETRPDAGEMRLDGEPLRPRSPADAIARGIGMVHQHFTLVPAMTVAENVALGGRGWFDRREAEALVRRLGDETGLVLDPAARVAELGVAAQQRLEIVKALARRARLLILDEPTAVLAPAEAGELLRWLRRFADAGNAVVLITHKLREAVAIADDVTVLRRGRTVATMRASDATESALAVAMLGGERRETKRASADADVPNADASRAPHDFGAAGDGTVAPEGALEANVAVGGGPPRHDTPSATAPGVAAPSTLAPRPSHSRPSPILRAQSLTLRDDSGVVRVRDATFDIRAGEIVGVAGVEGSGQRELLRALAGRLRPAAGTLELPARVGFVPEDRHRDALVLDFALAENVALRELGARRGLVPWRAVERRTRELLDAFDVRAPGPRARARTLSGGNQQKLVLARELGDRPEALVVESPTRGLDIRASEAVHGRLRDARDAGTAIVVYSGDLDEVLALADRVLVVYAGTVREAPRDRETVGRLMLGAP